MAFFSKSIVVNVGADYIENYLKKNNLQRTTEEQGQETEYWVNNLLQHGRIDEEKFEEFLFLELFWGKRKNIHVYKLERINKIKYPKDWTPVLQKDYGVNSLSFNNILATYVNDSEPRKIAAIHSEENVKGELEKIQLLFVSYIQISGANGYVDSSSYIPVEIDFKKRIMIIKAWNRQLIAHEDQRVNPMMEHIKKLMVYQFGVAIRQYMTEHKRVLFDMGRTLIYDAYNHIPNYKQINSVEDKIEKFTDNVIELLSLENAISDEKGKYMIPKEVMEFDAEIKNVIESLIISDYFYNKKFDEIWEMGLEAIVARVKFNDREQVLTSLNGENTEVPIFCTKTFMNLKKRLDDSQRIETLWITMSRKNGNRGNLNLKFDATNPEYLDILIKYGIRFDQSDMNLALEIYQKYESEVVTEIKSKNTIAIS